MWFQKITKFKKCYTNFQYMVSCENYMKFK